MYADQSNEVSEDGTFEPPGDEFWFKKQKGLDFGDDAGSNLSSLSLSMKRNNEFNQFDLLRCAGLNEIAENKTSELLITANISSAEEEREAKKLVKESNPLECHLKESRGRDKPSAHQTVKNMIFGLEYSLKPFKGKEEKLELLNIAVRSHDGNAILAVVLFLRNTLKKAIFQREIMKFPDAVNMYLSYLREDHETDELTNMLLLLRKPEDVAVLKYDAANLIRDQEKKSNVLKNLLNTYCQPSTVHRFLSESVLEHLMCIEDQKVLMDHQVVTQQNESIGVNIFENVTGRRQMENSSVIHALIFSIVNFYDVAEIAKISPATIRKRFKISPKQYQWCALRTLAAAKRFDELNSLFLVKKWLGGQKIQAGIHFQHILAILAKNDAPREVMEKYVGCLENPDTKLFFAQKYQCHSLAIEILKKKRDRQALLKYKSTLPPHSIDYCSIVTILNSEDVKWKN